MSDKAKSGDKIARGVGIGAPSVAVNISFPEHKSDGAGKVWLAAVGAALSGLAATWTAIKPPQPPVLPTPAPNPIVDRDHKDPPTIGLGLYNNLPETDYTLAPADLGPLVDTFAASRENRKIFVDGFRFFDTQATIEATDGEKAISTLLDPDEDTGHRVAAALYLGGHGKREYVSILKVASREDDVVGAAARVALEMVHEQFNHAAKRPPHILLAPAIPEPGEK